MALALTSGGESRLDGAPDQLLPPYEDSVEALAQALLAEDEDGVYGGDINMAREAARMQLGEMNARSVASRQAAAAAGAERNRMRAGRQAGGRPMEVEEAELGAVQQYADAEIADMRNPVGRGMQGRGPTRGSAAWDAQSLRHNADDLPYKSADEQSIREEYLRRFGRPPRTAEEVQLMRDLLGDEAEERMGGAGTWGEQKPFRSEAERDAYRAMTPDQMSQEQLDMMQVQGGGMGSQQGWSLVYHPDTGRLTPMQRAPAPEETPPYGFPDGSRVKTGERVEFVPQPESDEAKAVWNITSEYETNPGFSNAMTGGQRVGPGVDNMQVQPGLRNPALERDGYVPRWMEGPQGGEWVYDLAPQRRGALVRDRDNWQERQRRQRLAMRNGRSAKDAAALVGGQYEKEGRPLSFEDQLRMEGDLARMQGKRDRRSRVADQAQMAGGQPTGGPFGTRATTTAINQLGPGWREIALLDRLTNGRVGGPTPLAVEGANAAAAAQMAQQAMVAFLRNNPGAQPGQEVAIAGAEAQLPVNVQADLERRRNNGVLPANSAAGMALMDDIEDRYIGGGWGGNPAVDAAVEAAVRAGIPREEAELRYKHRRYPEGRGPGDAQGDRPPVGIPGGSGVGDMGQGFSG